MTRVSGLELGTASSIFRNIDYLLGQLLGYTKLAIFPEVLILDERS